MLDQPTQAFYPPDPAVPKEDRTLAELNDDDRAFQHAATEPL